MPKRANTSDTKTVSYRLPLRLYNKLSNYADEHHITNTEAAIHFIEAGMRAESDDKPITQADMALLQEQMRQGFQQMAVAIANQPIAIQPSLEVPQLENPDESSGKEEAQEQKPGLFHRLLDKLNS